MVSEFSFLTYDLNSHFVKYRINKNKSRENKKFERPHHFVRMIRWKMDWHTKNITGLKTLISGTFQEDAGKNQPEIQ